MLMLPKRLFGIRVDMVFLLCPSQQAENLYAVNDGTHALGVMTNIDENNGIACNVNTSLIMHAFAHNATNEYVLGYNDYLMNAHNKNALYIRKVNGES